MVVFYSSYFYHMLFIIGLLSLVFEILTGGFVFGLIGCLSITYTFIVGPFSLMGCMLSVLGIFFIFLEAFYPARALFFILGCLFSIFSFIPYQTNSHSIIQFVFVFVILLISFFFYLGARKIQSLKKIESLFDLVGKEGKVLADLSYAKVEGSIWKIMSQDPLQLGDTILVVSQKNLLLEVRKKN